MYHVRAVVRLIGLIVGNFVALEISSGGQIMKRMSSIQTTKLRADFPCCDRKSMDDIHSIPHHDFLFDAFKFELAKFYRKSRWWKKCRWMEGMYLPRYSAFSKRVGWEREKQRGSDSFFKGQANRDIDCGILKFIKIFLPKILAFKMQPAACEWEWSINMFSRPLWGTYTNSN